MPPVLQQVLLLASLASREVWLAAAAAASGQAPWAAASGQAAGASEGSPEAARSVVESLAAEAARSPSAVEPLLALPSLGLCRKCLSGTVLQALSRTVPQALSGTVPQAAGQAARQTQS